MNVLIQMGIESKNKMKMSMTVNSDQQIIVAGNSGK